MRNFCQIKAACRAFRALIAFRSFLERLQMRVENFLKHLPVAYAVPECFLPSILQFVSLISFCTTNTHQSNFRTCLPGALMLQQCCLNSLADDFVSFTICLVQQGMGGESSNWYVIKQQLSVVSMNRWFVGGL